ncbi:hypothetical protein CRI93_14120, partial [Longimonas halophila]
MQDRNHMKLETFDDVRKSIDKNSDREFQLLLGNGFSMAYDSDIFSYNALHDFVTALDDEDLTTIFSVVKTRNFEVIMSQLDNFLAILDALGGDEMLKKRLANASKKLKHSLLEAVKELHPEHVFKIPEDQSKSCSQFIRLFLDTGGSVYSTNYDLLLYWVLSRAAKEHYGLPAMESFASLPMNGATVSCLTERYVNRRTKSG